MNWKYYKGEWTKIDDPLVWNEDEEWGTILTRAGYHSYPAHIWGEEEDDHIELYIKQDDTPPYLINLILGGNIIAVYIDDLPNLMQWLKDYAPVFSLDIVPLLNDFLTLFARAFRAWHGHEWESPCAICDPYAYQRIQEIHQRQRERKRSNEQNNSK